MANGTSIRQPLSQVRASGPARTAQRHTTANERIRSAQGLDSRTNQYGKRLAGPQLLSYPVDNADTQQGHYVIFQIHAISNGKVTKTTDSSGFKKRSLALKGKSKSVATQIALYMPAEVSVQYKSNYEDVEIGATAEALANRLGEFNSTKEFWGAAGAMGGGAVDAAVGMGKRSVSTAVSGAANIVGGQGLKEAIMLTEGKVVTKKMEMLFTGVARRKFSFTFAFIPKSFQEAKQVDQIVQAFKLAMLPRYAESFGSVVGSIIGAGDSTGAGGEGRTMSIPTTMDIKYFFNSEDGAPKENEYINKISTCYLTDLDVKYGGDRYTAYAPVDGDKGAPPQNTTISMSFEEVEIITQEAAAQGY